MTDPAAAGAEDEYGLRLGGTAPVLGAAAALSLGLVLSAAGWKAHQINRLHEAAFRAGEDNEDQLRRRVALLAAAARLVPDDANLLCELGHARTRLFEKTSRGLPPQRGPETAASAQALQAYLRARDACPILTDAQLGVAALMPRLEKGDPQEEYLRRVKLLSPSQAERWFLCGRLELEAGREDDAWASWRRSLQLSDTYLSQILPRTVRRLTPEQLIEKVLPEDAGVLLSAAARLHPDSEAVEERRPFLEKALRVLDAKSRQLAARDWRVKALTHQALGQPEKAVEAYREMLGREPHRVEWRYEFARYLYELHQLDESRRELVIVLNQDPSHGLARELIETVTAELLREKWADRKGKRE